MEEETRREMGKQSVRDRQRGGESEASRPPARWFCFCAHHGQESKLMWNAHNDNLRCGGTQASRQQARPPFYFLTLESENTHESVVAERERIGREWVQRDKGSQRHR